jgi:hypothetical protein
MKQNNHLSAVRQAIEKMIPDCQEIEYDPIIDEVIVSLGEKNFRLMIFLMVIVVCLVWLLILHIEWLG